MKMQCVVWILLFLKLLGAAADFPVTKSCLPHALRLQRIQAFPVDKEITATAMIKDSNGFFLCTARKPALKPQSTIACRNFPIKSYGETSGQFYPVATVEGEISDFKVLSRRHSSLVIAVIKNDQSRLFAVHPNGTYLSFTELGPIGSIGARTIRMVQNRDRVAVITSSSRLCQSVGHDCNVPGVEVISSDNVVTRCISPEFGASHATTGWPFGRYFYIVHALKNPKNPEKMQLTLFRLDESDDPTHCLLETLETLDIDIKPPLCDAHSLRLFRASGMYFLLISSHDCEKPASEKTGSTRNILTLQWSPITGLLDEKSLAELKDTDHVREVTSLSASIFLLDRPNIYPSTIHCLTADILRSGSYDGIHKAELETVATLPPSPGASRFTAMNNNEGRIYVARITEDAKRGHIVEIDQLSCQDSDYPNRGNGAVNNSSRNGPSASQLRKVDPRQSQHALYGANGNGAVAGKQVFTNWIGDFHDYEDAVPLLVPAPKLALRSVSQTNSAPEAPVWRVSRRLKFPEELESEESAYEEIPFAQYIAETSTYRSHEGEDEEYSKGISYVNDTISFLELEAPIVALAAGRFMHKAQNETAIPLYHVEEDDHEMHERISYGNDSIEFLDVEGPNPASAGTYRNVLGHETAASHDEEGEDHGRLISYGNDTVEFLDAEGPRPVHAAPAPPRQQYLEASPQEVEDHDRLISYGNDTIEFLDAEGPSPVHVVPAPPRQQYLPASAQVPHGHGIRYGEGLDVSQAAGEWDYDHTHYDDDDEQHEPGIRYNQTVDFPIGPDMGYQQLNQTRKIPVVMPVNQSQQEYAHDHIHYDYDEQEVSEPELRPPVDSYNRAQPTFVQQPPVNYVVPQVPVAVGPAFTYVAPTEHQGKGLHYDQKYGLHFDNGPNRQNYSESVQYSGPTIARHQDIPQIHPRYEEHPEMSYHDFEGEDLPRIRYNDSLYDTASPESQNEIDGYVPPPVPLIPELPQGALLPELPYQAAAVPDSPPVYPQMQPVPPLAYAHHGVRYTDREGIRYLSGPKHRNYSEALPPSQPLPIVHIPVPISPSEQMSYSAFLPDRHGIRHTNQSGIHYYSGPKHRNYSEVLAPFLSQPAAHLPVLVAPAEQVPGPYNVPYLDRHGIRHTDQSGIHYYSGPKHRNYSEVLPQFPSQPADVPVFVAAAEQQVLMPYNVLHPNMHGVRYTNQSGLHYFSGPKHRNYSEALPPFLLKPIANLPVFVPTADQGHYEAPTLAQHGLRYTNQSGIRYDSGPKHQNFSEEMPLFHPVPIAPASYIQYGVPQHVPETTVKHGVRYTNQSGIHYQHGPKHRNYSEGMPPSLTQQFGNFPVLYNQYEVSQYVQTADGTVKRRRLRFYKNESGENTGLLSENQPYRVDLSDALPAPTHESSTMVAQTIQASQSKIEPVLPPAAPTLPAGTGRRRLRFDQPPTPLSPGIRYNTGPNRHNFSETLPEHFAQPVLSKLEQYAGVALHPVFEIPVMHDVIPDRIAHQEQIPFNQSSLQQLPYVQTDIPVYGHKPGIHHDNGTRAGIHYRHGQYRHDYSEAVRPFDQHYIPDKTPEQYKPPVKGRRLRYGEFYPKADEKGIQFDNGTQRYNVSEAVQPAKINLSYAEAGAAYEVLPVDVGMTSQPLTWPMKSSRAIRYDNGSSIEEDEVENMVTVSPYSPAADPLSGWTRGVEFDDGPYRQNYSAAGFASPYTVPLHFIPTMYQQRRNATYGQAFFPVTKPYLSKLHFENETAVDEGTTMAPRTTITYGTSRRMRYDDKDGIKYDVRPEDEAEEASTAVTIKRTVPPSFIPKVHFNYSSMGNETKEAAYLERKAGIRFDNYSKVEDEAEMKASTLVIPLIPSTKHGIVKKVRFNGTTGFTKMLSGKRYPSKPYRADGAAPMKRPHRLKYDNTSTAELQYTLGKLPGPKVIKPVRFDNETAVEEKDAYTKIPVSAQPLHYNDTSRITTLGVENSQQVPIVIRKFRQNETTAEYTTGSVRPRINYNQTRNDMDYQDIPEASRSVYQPRQKLMSIRMRYDNDSSDAIGLDDVQPSGEAIRLVRLTTNVDQAMETPSPTWVFLNGTLPGHLKSVGVPVTFVERPMGPAKVLPIRLKENVSEADHDYEEKEMLKETYQNVSQQRPSNVIKGISYENETGVDRLGYHEYESTTAKETLTQPLATMPSVSVENSTLRLRYGEAYADEDHPYLVQTVYPSLPVYAAPLQPPGPTGINIEDVDIGDDMDEDVFLKKYYVPIPEMIPSQPLMPSEIPPPQILVRNNWERTGGQRFKGRYNQSEVDEINREPVLVKHLEKDLLYAEPEPALISPVSPTVEISPPAIAVSPVQVDLPPMPERTTLTSGWERSASGRSFIRRYNGTSIDALYTQSTGQLQPSIPSANVPGPVQTGWKRAEPNRAFSEPYNLTSDVPYEVISPVPPAVSVVSLIPSQAPFTLNKIETNWDTLSFDDYTDLAVLPALSVPVQQESMEPHFRRPEFSQRYNYSLHDESDEFRFPVLPPEQPKVYPDISGQSQSAPLGYDLRPINTSLVSQQELPPLYIPTGWERAAPNVAFVDRYNVTRQLLTTSQPGFALPHLYPFTSLDREQEPTKHRYETIPEAGSSAEVSRAAPVLTEQRLLTSQVVPLLPVPSLRRAPLPSAGLRDEYTDSSRNFKRRFNESLDHHPEVPLEDVMKAADAAKQSSVPKATVPFPQELSETKPVKNYPLPRLGWERASEQQFFGKYNESVPKPVGHYPPVTGKMALQVALPPSVSTGWGPAVLSRPVKERYNYTDFEMKPHNIVVQQPMIAFESQLPLQRTGWEKISDQGFSGRYNISEAEIQPLLTKPVIRDWQPPSTGPGIPQIQVQQFGHTGWERVSGQEFPGRYNVSEADMQPFLSPPVFPDQQRARTEPEVPQMQAQQFGHAGWERASAQQFSDRYNQSVPYYVPVASPQPLTRPEIQESPRSSLALERQVVWQRPDGRQHFVNRYNATGDDYLEGMPFTSGFVRSEKEASAALTSDLTVSPAELSSRRDKEQATSRMGVGWERQHSNLAFDSKYNGSEIESETDILPSVSPAIAPADVPEMAQVPGSQLSGPSRTGWERADLGRYFKDRYNNTEPEPDAPQTVALQQPMPPAVFYQPVLPHAGPGWERTADQQFSDRYNESAPVYEPFTATTTRPQVLPVYVARQGINWERSESRRGFAGRYNATISDETELPFPVYPSVSPQYQDVQDSQVSSRLVSNWERESGRAFDPRYNETVPEETEKSEPDFVPITEPTVPVYAVRQGTNWERPDTNRGFVGRYNGTLPDEHEESDTVLVVPSQPKAVEQPAPVRVGTGWERPTEQAAFDSRYNESVPLEETEMPTTQTVTDTYVPERIPHTTIYPQYQGIRWERPDDQRGFVGRYNAIIPDHHDEPATAPATPLPRKEEPVRESKQETIRVGSAWERPGSQSFDKRYNETEEQLKKRTGKPPQRILRLFGPRYDQIVSETEYLEVAGQKVTLPSPMPPATETMSMASAWRFERVPGSAFSSRFNDSDETSHPAPSKYSLRYNESTHPKDHDELPIVPLPVAARRQKLPDMMFPVDVSLPPPLPTLPTLTVSRYGSQWERPDSDRPFKDRFNRTKPSKYKAPGTILSLFDRARPTVYSPQSFGSRFNASIEQIPERVAPIRHMINVDTDAEVPDWQRKLVFINASLSSGFNRPEIAAPLTVEPKANATQPCLNKTDAKAPLKYTERVAGSNPNLYGIIRDEKLEEMFDESLSDLVFSLRKSQPEPAKPTIPQPVPTDAMIPVQPEERFQVPMFVNRSFAVPSYPVDLPPTIAPQLPYATNAMQKYYVPTRIHIPLPTELQPQYNSSRLTQEFFHFTNGTYLQATLGPIQTSKHPKRPVKGFKTGVSRPIPPFHPGQSNVSQLTANKPRRKFATNASLVRPTPGRTRTPVHSLTSQQGIAAYSYDPNQPLPTRRRSKGFKVTKRPTPPDIHYTLGFTVPPYSPPPVIEMQPIMPGMTVNTSWNMPPLNTPWNIQPMMPTMNTTWNVPYGHYNVAVPMVNVSHIAMPPQPYFPPSDSYFPAQTNITKAVWSTNQTECCQNITVDAGQVLDIFVNKTNDLSVLDTIKINMSAAPPRNSSVTGYSVKLQLVRAPLVSLASICNAPIVVEPQGIMKEIDCSQRDIGDVAIGVHVRAGSGSFHFDIINKTEATDGNKFIIDETNGYLYPSVPFHEKAPADSKTLLGAGHGYDVLVQVTDTICDVSDHAYVSVMFVCRHDVTTHRTRRPRSYRKQS